MICDNNQILFKGYVSSWLALTGLLLPKEHDKIKPKLKGSAISLAESCDGMGNNTCGVRWWPKQWDGWNGMEEMISAACGFSSNLLLQKGKSPVTTFTGGNSTSNPNAGSGGGGNRDGSTLEPITTGDKAGAGILTAFFIPGWVALMAWMVLGG
jgi:mannan endo-1,6-alpha-mannosidase